MTAATLSLRSAVALCLLVLLLALLCFWSLSQSELLPASGKVPPAMLPHFVMGFALIIATFGAPYIFNQNDFSNSAPTEFLLKAAQAALWLGVAGGYILLTTARLAPLSAEGIMLAALGLAVLVWMTLLLEKLMPHAAAAVLFVWLVALPISTYMLTEVFLAGPGGGSSLVQSTAPQAAALRVMIHWALTQSPSAAIFGALTGLLADGSTFYVWEAGVPLLLLNLVLIVFVLRQDSPAAL